MGCGGGTGVRELTGGCSVTGPCVGLWGVALLKVEGTPCGMRLRDPEVLRLSFLS